MNRTRLTTADRQAFRRRLKKLITRLSGGAQPRAEVSTGEFALRGAGEEVVQTHLASEELVLDEAAAALGRLILGVFGTCAECGRGIAKTRLDVLPYARTCVRCARVETAEGAIRAASA
ncbi:MAG: TraR/DksA C4-type zinc finger protein [Planctomycetes bacterium]|nr:TraR/DksA C4-type zinc finger protein [Planctomycetota bacterium]